MQTNYLFDINWVLAYNAPYNDYTVSTDISLSSYSTLQYPYMCVGAFSSSSSSFAKLMACGRRSKITKFTSSLYTAYEENGVYWYNVNSKSFGFASQSSIDLNSADTLDQNCQYRLSWHLDQLFGGYRAGCILSLNDNLVWYKKIFLIGNKTAVVKFSFLSLIILNNHFNH